MRTLFGAILMAIGVLIAGTAGLCGAILLVMASATLRSPHPSEVMDVAAMVIAPFLIGAGLFYAGYRVQKADRRGPK